MKSPHVSIENAEAVVEYFSSVEPSVPLMRAFHFLTGHLVRGTTYYEDGAKEAIADWLDEGKQLLIPHNHQDWMDPVELASLFEREQVFHSLRTNTVIPAKSTLFNSWYDFLLNRTGAIPVFRKRDFKGDDELRRIANDALIEIFQNSLNKRMHVVIYPQETRGLSEADANERDPRIIKKIAPGIGRIACGASRPEDIAVVAMGTIFGKDNSRRFHPVTFVKNPSFVENPEQVVAETKEKLQDAVIRVADLAGFAP